MELQFDCAECHHPIPPLEGQWLKSLPCPACGATTFVKEAQRTIGPYLLERKLGEGSFGSVWQALDLRVSHRLVAIKIFVDESIDDSSGAVKHMIRESRIAGGLDHPNVVGVTDFNSVDEMHYLVTPYIKGTTLSEWMTNPDLSFDDRAAMMAEIGDAVQYLHDQGVIHHDLKPNNVLVDRNNHPHIIDFGLAATKDAACQEVDEIRRLHFALQHTGKSSHPFLIGTVEYMAPEKVKIGEPVNYLSDVFSLGVIFFEMLCGRRPYHATGEKLLHAVAHGHHSRPRRWNRQIPRELEAICLTAMARRPEHRYQSAADMAHDCRMYLLDEPISVRPPSVFSRFT